MRFMLRSVEDRKRAFREIREAIVEDVFIKKCLPYLHVLVIDSDGSVYNRYLGLYTICENGSERCIYIDVFSIEFALRLFLKLKRVTEVEYDPDECRVVVTYENR